MKEPGKSTTLYQCPECGETTYPYIIACRETATVILRCDNCLSRVESNTGITEDEEFLLHMYNAENGRRLIRDQDLRDIFGYVQTRAKMRES